MVKISFSFSLIEHLMLLTRWRLGRYSGAGDWEFISSNCKLYDICTRDHAASLDDVTEVSAAAAAARHERTMTLIPASRSCLHLHDWSLPNERGLESS